MKVSTNDFKAHYQSKANECKAKCESCKCSGDLVAAKMHETEAENYENAVSKIN